MYPVTQDFLEKMRADERRVHGKIQIDYTDPFIDQSIQVAASEQANVSYPAQTADAVSEPFAKIASLDGSWVLDGTHALAPDPDEAETHQMGWWGSQLAGPDETFTEPYPTLTVTFFSRPITQLKVVGDSKRGEYPVDFVIKLYDATDTVLYTETVTGNTQVTWQKTLTSPVTQVVKMTLEITKWSHPGRQAKILEFFTSVQETYEGDDILLIHLLEEREVSQGSLPVGNISANEIDIRFENSSRKFDAGNTQSPLCQLLKQNRRIRAWLGMEAENLESENPPTFNRNSVAYLSDGTQVAVNQPRFEQGKFGQAVMVEEGTTNGFTYPLTQEYYGGALRTAGSYYTTSGFRIIATGQPPGGPLPGCRLNIISGKFTVKGRTDRTDYIQIYWRGFDSAGNTVISQTFTTATVTNGAFEKTIDLGTVSGLSYIHVGVGRTNVADYWIEYVQVEAKPYATSFIDGTRSAETLTIPTAGVLNEDEFTIEGWFTPAISSSAAPAFARIWALKGVPLAGLYNNGGVIRFAWNNKEVLYTGISLNADDQVFYSVSKSGSNVTVHLAKNGGSISTFTGTTDVTILGATEIVLGSNGFEASFFNGKHDDLRISSRARTDEEIAAAYASGEPLPVDADTTYKLTFNGSIYPVEKVWVPLGTFWSGDWSAPEDGVYAQTTGRDRLELLRKSTCSTSTVQQNKTLYDLAVAVLQDAGLKSDEYWVDSELQQYTIPYAYFEPMSHRNALRLIAEACLGQVYADREGIIRVEGPSYLASQMEAVLEIGPDDYFRKDNPVKWSEIANYIEVETQPLKPVGTAQEVYRSNEPVTVSVGEQKSLTVYYNEVPCIEASASLEGATNTTISSVTYYAWGADLTLSNSGASDENVTVVINAKPLKVLNRERAVAKDDVSITDNGLIKYTFPANPLVQTLSMAQTIAGKLLASFKNPRRDIEVEWRGNPALLLGDRVKVTDRNEQNDYYVVRQEIEFAGALRAKLSGRRAT